MIKRDLDRIISDDAAGWLGYMYELLDREITIELEENSSSYKEIRKKIKNLYDAYPEFEKIIDNSDNQKALVLSEERAKKLAELVEAEFKILEICQRMLYIKGIRDGINYSKYLEY